MEHNLVFTRLDRPTRVDPAEWYSVTCSNGKCAFQAFTRNPDEPIRTVCSHKV